MDKLKDIITNINERYSSPLMFSFFCSWLVINWQITVALVWYDTKQLEKAGFTSIFDFIRDKIHIQDALFHPLYFALGYTLFMPIIKNLIQALNSWAVKWGDNWNLRILKGGKIPIEKYFNLRKDFEKRTEILEDVIAKESKFEDKYNSERTSLLEAKTTESALKQRLIESENIIHQFNNLIMLNGYWTNTYEGTYAEGGIKGSEEIYIENGGYSIIKQFGEKKHTFNITNFHFDSRNLKMFFIKERLQPNLLNPPNDFKYNVNNLNVERDMLVGVENGTIKIQYERKIETPLKTKSITEK